MSQPNLDIGYPQLQQVITDAEQAIEQLQHLEGIITQMETVAGGATTIQQGLDDSLSQFAEIETALTEELQQVTNTIGGLKDKASEVENKVAESVGQVKIQLESLKEQVESALGELQLEAEKVIAITEQLGQEVESFTSEMDEHLEASQSGLTDLQEVVESVTTSFHDRSSTLVENFNTFEQGTQAKLEAITEQFSTLLAGGMQQLQDLEMLLDNISEDALDKVSQRLTEELLGELTQSAGDLKESIGILSQAGQSSKDLLDGEVGEILDKVGDVTDLIEQIKPVLDLVKNLL